MSLGGSAPGLSSYTRVVGLTAVLTLAAACVPTPDTKGQIGFSSPDKNLVAAFDWAKAQALAYAFEGDEVGPWYEAALPEREAFCMRDVSHQAIGAHALGLHQHNLNMFRRFAENISESKDWASYWEINRHNQPAPVDYRNDDEFWYNLPANFDVLDASWRLYSWTADRAYLDDPVFENFYRRTVTNYVERWDLGLDEIMERNAHMNLRVPLVRDDYYRVARGLSTYDESDFDVVVGVDLLAVQAAGYQAYARIGRLTGRDETAAFFEGEANAVRRFIDQSWWDPVNSRYHAFYLGGGIFDKSAGRALLYWDALSDPDRIQSHLLRLVNEPPENIESLSHYPEIFYRYGADVEAYQTLLDLAHPATPRREYPEVSFAVIGAIVAGSMGVQPDASTGVVATMSHLTEPTDSAELTEVPVFGQSIDVRHVGRRETTLRNRGRDVLLWEARFPGAADSLAVGGEVWVAQTSQRHEVGFSGVLVSVPPGESRTVQVHLEPGTP